MSLAPPTLCLLHGWALKPGLWRGVTRLLPLPHACPDLGYFGPADGTLPAEGPLVLGGHSLGFLWWLRRLEEDETLRRRTIGLISVNGFSRFVRGPDFPHGVQERVVRRMVQRLEQEPRALLEEFGRAGGMRTPMPPEGMELPRLAEGLGFLATWDGRPALARLGLPLRALASDDDAIVPPTLTRACFPEESLHWHPAGSHLLPLTQPAWCAERIGDFVEQLL